MERSEYNRLTRINKNAMKMLCNAIEHLVNSEVEADRDEGYYNFPLEDAIKILEKAADTLNVEDKANRKAANVGIYKPYGNAGIRHLWR
jgi:hypothetical protein